MVQGVCVGLGLHNFTRQTAFLFVTNVTQEGELIMRKIAFVSVLALFACSDSGSPTITAPEPPVIELPAPDIIEASVPSLEQVWLTEGFSDPEGVAVQGEILFISNVAGEGNAKDGEGWISRVSLSGEGLEARWVEGLNGPKGMAVRGDKLFVSDIDAYHVIDIPSAEIDNTYPIEGAGFMNDVTVWQGGVYASDSATARIFQLDENGYKEWLSDERLGGVNGLTADGDRLLISTMSSGSLFETKGAGELTGIATGMENADGIAVLNDGSYLVSSWPGQIWHVSTAGETVELVNSVDQTIYQNDLTRVGDLIIVPNWQPGTVTAWRVVAD